MSTFGKENQIKITFLDDETFKGHVKGAYHKRCEISGKFEADFGDETGDWEQDVTTWQCRYKELDEGNYERENRDRWR